MVLARGWMWLLCVRNPRRCDRSCADVPGTQIYQVLNGIKARCRKHTFLTFTLTRMELTPSELASGYDKDARITRTVDRDQAYWLKFALERMHVSEWAVPFLHQLLKNMPVDKCVAAFGAPETLDMVIASIGKASLVPGILASDWIYTYKDHLYADIRANSETGRQLVEAIEESLKKNSLEPHYMLACGHFIQLLHKCKIPPSAFLSTAMADLLRGSGCLYNAHQQEPFLQLHEECEMDLAVDPEHIRAFIADALRAWAYELPIEGAECSEETLGTMVHVACQLYEYVKTPLVDNVNKSLDTLSTLFLHKQLWTTQMVQAVHTASVGKDGMVWPALFAELYTTTGYNAVGAERALLVAYTWITLCKQHKVSQEFNQIGWLALLLEASNRAAYLGHTSILANCCFVASVMWKEFVSSMYCQPIIRIAIQTLCENAIVVDRDEDTLEGVTRLMREVARHAGEPPMRDVISTYLHVATRLISFMPSDSHCSKRLEMYVSLIIALMEARIPRVPALLCQQNVHLAIGSVIGMSKEDPEYGQHVKRLDAVLQAMSQDTDARRWLCMDRFGYNCEPVSRQCTICLDNSMSRLPFYICPACNKEIGHVRCTLAWCDTSATCPLCRCRM